MSEPLVGLLVTAAISVASLHALAPDHWVPLAAVARARGWGLARTVRVTALCGFGHVTVSVLLGLLALAFGLELLEMFGRRMEAIAGLLLIGFGLAYGLAGLRRGVAAELGHVHVHDAGGHAHVHSHAHGLHHHHHGHGELAADRWTFRTLFLVFAADPCVAVIPILFASAPLGAWRTAAVIGAYELATIATMIALVVPAHAASSIWKSGRLIRFGDAVAGGLIATTGVMVAILGI